MSPRFLSDGHGNTVAVLLHSPAGRVVMLAHQSMPGHLVERLTAGRTPKRLLEDLELEWSVSS